MPYSTIFQFSPDLAEILHVELVTGILNRPSKQLTDAYDENGARIEWPSGMPYRKQNIRKTERKPMFVDDQAKARYFKSLSENDAYLKNIANRFSDLDYGKEISKNDWMPNENSEQYYQTGLAAISAINRCLEAKQVDVNDISTILDFGCGHGRVTRMLRAKWPDARIDATDIVADAIEYCAAKFRCIPISAPHDINKTNFPKNTYDVIFCGSIFTHLDVTEFKFLIRHLTEALTPNGVLVFTTAGHYVANLIRGGYYGAVRPNSARSMLCAFDENGFGFGFYTDHEGRRWGWTISSAVVDCKSAWGSGCTASELHGAWLGRSPEPDSSPQVDVIMDSLLKDQFNQF